jgi:hypothetical protein
LPSVNHCKHKEEKMQAEKNEAAVRIGRLNKSRSKDVEREWAKRFGTRRLDAIAGAGTRQADIRFISEKLDVVFDIEIKSRIRPSISLYEEAVAKAQQDMIPVLGLEVRTGAGHPNPRYCILSREDFCTLIGAKAEEE